jgi:hypothetical protein
METEVTIEQKRNSPVDAFPFLAMLLGLLIGLSTTLSASCQGAAGISPEQLLALRNLLSPATAPADFHVHAETTSTDRRTHFVLYSISKGADPGAPTVHLAAISLEPQPNVLSAVDVSADLPPFARVVPSQSNVGFPIAPRGAEPATVEIDGCLNAFVLQPDLQAVHMNLFARSRRSGSEGANDIVFVLLDNTSLRPVLELNQSSWYDKRLHQDSVIAVLPSAAACTDIIWWQSSQQSGGVMMAAAFAQNSWYRWKGKGFEKMGTLEESDLAARLRSAFRLTRSDEISSIEMKLLSPRLKQPPQ